MTGTGLLRGTGLTATGARAAQFPAAVLGGYNARAVEAFRKSAEESLRQHEAALADSQRANAELVRRIAELEEQGGAGDFQSAARILQMAQQNADHVQMQAREEAAHIVGQARQQAEQLTEHARQQAAGIIEQATGEASARAEKIIDDATADGRKLASQWRHMAGEMHDHMREVSAGLLVQVGEWDKRAQDGLSATVS